MQSETHRKVRAKVQRTGPILKEFKSNEGIKQGVSCSHLLSSCNGRSFQTN